MKRSLRAKGVSGLLTIKSKITYEPNPFSNIKMFKKKEKFCVPPKQLKARYTDNKNGRIIYLNEKSNSNIVIIYLHGGSYCADFLPFHWWFIKKIMKKTNAKVIAPAYRLAPFATYKEAFNLIVPIYKRCIKSNKRVIIMGDSAGGGLAMALAIHFKLENLRLPDELILYSPWVDVSMENEEIKHYKNKDPFLNVKALIESVKPWLGELDNHDWHVSPLYGDLKGIHNVSVFVGTREVLYPDIIKFYNKLDPDISNTLIVGEGMNHAYPLIPIPESKIAIKKIIEIILKNKNDD